MEYVEILRARRVLIWYCGILLAILIIAVVSLYSGHANIHQGNDGGGASLASLIQACAFGAIIVATCVAPGLNAESGTLAITWTRPMPRTAIALRYIAVDVATILFAWAFTVLITVLFFAAFNSLNEIRLGDGIGAAFLNGLGCALMWYGLVTLVSARLNGRGGLIAGLSWGVFIVLTLLWIVPFPAPIHMLVNVLNYFNPLTYFHNVGEPTHHSHLVLDVSENILTLIAWGFVAVTLAGTVRLWSTREV
jgi:hypothetical protein